jgi:hypothetical protein
MSRKFLVSIDLNKNELQNAVIQNLATAPSSPLAGQVYYNTADNQLYIYNGTRWEVAGNAISSGLLANRPAANSVDAGTIFYATDTFLFYYSDGSTWTQTNAFGTVTAQTTYGASSGNGSATTYARADHTHGTPALGTSTPNAISGAAGSAGTAAVPSKEDHTHAFTPSTNLSMATFKLTNLGTPTTSTDAATKAYADLMLPLAGGTMSGAIAMGTNKITGLGTPTSDADAATKLYVDSVAQGLNVHPASFAATTANLNATYSNGSSGVGATLTNAGAQAAFTTDGTSPALNARILVKNQTTTSQNGIYTLTTVGTVSTNWVLTRATDFDTAAEIAGGDFTFVDTGTTLADTGWVCVNEVTTVGTDPVVFSQFSGAGTYIAGDGLTLTGNTFAVGAGTGITVGPDSVSLTNTSLTVNGTSIALGASGTITANTTNALTLGTGLTGTSFNGSAAVTAAIDTSVVVRKYGVDVGNGSATSYTITHNLGTRDVQVTVYENSGSYAEVICDVNHATTNTVTLLFSVAPTSNQYRVVVQG